MEVNADLEQSATVHAQNIPWIPSPMAGVERRMLDRIGDEVARATSIVRYAPGSSFSAHTHTGGEEFLVLEGIFQDEQGDFPAGTYVRNPPTSRHTPRSEGGATIFVKLWQFDLRDRQQVTIDTAKAIAVPVGDGLSEIPLFADSQERVRIAICAAGYTLAISTHQGLEVLVLDGGFTIGEESYHTYSWLRLPPGMPLMAKVGEQGARLWIKSDHLAKPWSLPEGIA